MPAHRADDAEYHEVLGRWLDVLQARAPGAVVQLVISHADRLNPASLDPEALKAAAEPQLAWLQARVEQHQSQAKALAAALQKPIELLRVQPVVPCVCAAEGGTASLLALRAHLETLVTAQPPLLPSAGTVIPRSWLPALALGPALRDGKEPIAAAQQALELPDQEATEAAGAAAATGAAPAAEKAAAATEASAGEAGPVSAAPAKKPYTMLADLQKLWAKKVVPAMQATLGTLDDAGTILADALRLQCNQGDLFAASGIVFLDPAFATEMLKPLVVGGRPAAHHILAHTEPSALSPHPLPLPGPSAQPRERSRRRRRPHQGHHRCACWPSLHGACLP